jgi:hypothetical protein
MTDETLRARVENTLALVERVNRSLDNRSGEAREMARRERQRLHRDLGRRLAKIGIAVGLISIAVIALGLVVPIGMFGFLAAVGLAIGVAALLAFWPARPEPRSQLPADLPNAELVQRFDSLLYRSRAALPAPAQVEIDAISAKLSTLRQTLERVGDLDPTAQDARRLMSKHLPGLIDRYRQIPSGYRSERDGEGLTVDERLIEGLHAGREALEDIADRLARDDLRAFETHGRFIQSRYGDSSVPAKAGTQTGEADKR